MLKPISIALLITGILIAIVLGARACLRSTSDFAIRELMGSGYRDYDIEGEVLDENGAALALSNVHISASRSVKAGLESKDDNSSLQLAGHKFHIERNGYSSISLHITRHGYQPQNHDFTGGGKFKNVKIFMKPQTTTSPSRGPIYYESHRSR